MEGDRMAEKPHGQKAKEGIQFLAKYRFATS